MNSKNWIESPDDPALDQLCEKISEMANKLETQDSWPEQQLRECGEAGVFSWFLSKQHGGQQWSDADVVRGYLKLSAACLTTAFVITQRTGACRRIALSENEATKTELLTDLCSGKTFSTVGISHLTTSRRHLKNPVLRAEKTANGYRLDGFSPWITGATAADSLVIGATLEDGREILITVPCNLPGVTIPAAAQLVGLSASQTGRVDFDQVEVDEKWLLAGPVENVMQGGSGARTGGLETSTLAIGLSAAALNFLKTEREKRDDLAIVSAHFDEELMAMTEDLLAASSGQASCSNEQLRTRANSLVLRSTQAALTAAKGTGYVQGHPTGRWCREALFFLVWSCPQPVLNANLCELAGIES
ncbi:MAG: acyl-CoA dehydrogenase family protein [Pirellulales bacterium]